MPYGNFLIEEPGSAVGKVEQFIGAFQHEWLETINQRFTGLRCTPHRDSCHSTHPDRNSHRDKQDRYADVLPDLTIDNEAYLHPNLTIEKKANLHPRKKGAEVDQPRTWLQPELPGAPQ